MPKLNAAVKVEAKKTSEDTKTTPALEVNDKQEEEKSSSVEKPALTIQIPVAPKQSSKPPSPVPKPHKVKRKAEVLSKESGKVGVTITTSPPVSESKVPKLQSPTNIQNNNTPLVASTPDSGRIPKRKSSEHALPAVLNNQNSPAPENQHLTLTAVLQSTPASVKTRDTLAAAAPISSRKSGEPARPQEDAATAVTQGASGQHQALDTASVAETPSQRLQYKTILANPGPEYWLARNPVVDNVFITDVTVNLNTVTIRECKTEKGFFKSNVEARI